MHHFLMQQMHTPFWREPFWLDEDLHIHVGQTIWKRNPQSLYLEFCFNAAISFDPLSFVA
jgi:hypothetical protein